MDLVLIKVGSRNAHASEVQGVLSKYGCHIAVRLGLHEITDESCANDGLIILQVKPDKDAINGMISELKAIKDIEVKSINF